MGIVLMFVGFWVVGTAMAKGIGLAFAGMWEDEVRRHGGTVLKTRVRLYLKGPYGFFAERRTVVKVIYRDRDGTVQQLWGRSKGWFEADHTYTWDYSDGDNEWNQRGLGYRLLEFFFM